MGHGTDCGRVREQNEDTYFADADLGVYCIVDGMGGHAGGQLAAKLASEQIVGRMRIRDKDPATRIREAIALANRAIYKERDRRPEYAEMACVLTLANIEEDHVTVGHVGDTRLYKIHQQALTPITLDHSPVGMLVHQHRLTEVEAMKHPNRNLVSRDVGSADHQPFDPDFIDIYSFDLEPDAAILLSSDGLCDQVRPDTILATVRQYAKDPQAAVDTLIRLANDAGGKDNVSVILVCGPEFAAANGLVGDQTTERLTFDSDSAPPIARRWLVPAVLTVAAAMLVAILSWRQPSKPTAPTGIIYVDPEMAADDANHFRTLAPAIQSAASGSVIRVLAGRHPGPITLRAGVQLQAAPGRDVTLFIEGGSPAVLVADQLVEAAVVDGFHIQATGAQTGVEVHGSRVVLKNNTISGAAEAGVRAGSGSTVEMSGNRIESAPGTVGLVAEGSALDVRANHFVLTPGTLQAKAVEARESGEYRVTFEHNELIGCAGECVIGVHDWRQKNQVQPPASTEKSKSRVRKKGAE